MRTRSTRCTFAGRKDHVHFASGSGVCGVGRLVAARRQVRGWPPAAPPERVFCGAGGRDAQVGETKPAQVLADIVIDTGGLFGEARFEWDQLKQHDVLFLLSMVPPEDVLEGDEARPAEERAGLKYVRGCELVEVRGGRRRMHHRAHPEFGELVELLLLDLLLCMCAPPIVWCASWTSTMQRAGKCERKRE